MPLMLVIPKIIPTHRKDVVLTYRCTGRVTNSFIASICVHQAFVTMRSIVFVSISCGHVLCIRILQQTAKSTSKTSLRACIWTNALGSCIGFKLTTLHHYKPESSKIVNRTTIRHLEGYVPSAAPMKECKPVTTSASLTAWRQRTRDQTLN